jgi:hypothetical protein
MRISISVRNNVALAKSRRIVHKSDIPPTLRGLKILNPNSGGTAIVLEKDVDNVYVITRDVMKKEWLVNGLRLSDDVQVFDFVNHRVRGGLGEEPVYVITMPKLFPLSSANKRKVNQSFKEFRQLYLKHRSLINSKYRNQLTEEDKERYATSEVLAEMEDNSSNNILIPYLTWVVNYDEYAHDIGPRNFMQDKQGEIVVLDPVAAYQVAKYFGHSL